MKNVEIAKELGISTTTVSLAINGRPGVSEELRKKILYMKTLDHPEAVADPDIPTEHHPSDSYSINFVIHKVHGIIMDEKPFFGKLIGTIQQEAQKNGCQLNMLSANSTTDPQQFQEILMASGAAGTIVLATELLSKDLDIYKDLNQPVVLLDGYFPLDDFDCVTMDNEDALYQAYAYAYELGHRDIGYLASSVEITNFVGRFDGYKRAERNFGLDKKEHEIIYLYPDMDRAYQDMSSYMEKQPADHEYPTCFFSDLDYIALGAMKAFKERGYKIPEDISIIGFDDIVAGQVFHPALTTIQVDQEHLGIIAFDTLRDRIRHPETSRIITRVSTKLLLRGSICRRDPQN